MLPRYLKKARMNIEKYVERLAKKAMKQGLSRALEPTEDVPSGSAIELWSDAFGERFWFVVNVDPAKIEERRRVMYAPGLAQCVIQIGDTKTVAEVHLWRRRFEGVSDD